MKASDNPFPSALFVEGTVPASPAAGDQRVYIDSADHKLKRVNSAGTVTTIEGGSAASFSGARVTMTSQAIPSATPTAITWASTIYDTNTFWSNTNATRLTFAAAGYYIVNGCVEFPSNPTGGAARSLEIRLNGTTSLSYQTLFGNTGYERPNVTFVGHFAAADYVEMYAYQDTGSSSTIVSTNVAPYLSVALLVAG